MSIAPELGFVGGTRVHTREGLKAIEHIRVGDWVLTHPEHVPPPRRRRQEGEYQYRQVTRTRHLEVRSFVRIHVQNLADGIEDTLLIARDQPVWTQPHGWVAAKHIAFGQALVLSFNGNALVQKVEASEQAARVHRLEVDGDQTCYVAKLGTWVGCNPDAVLSVPPPAQTKETVGFTEPQMLLDIKDYYNDTQAPPEPPPGTPQDLAGQMRAAAEKLRSVFKEQMQQELDYDEEGVRWLAGYIDRARLRLTDDPSRRGAIQLIGAFLGECVIHEIGGRWVMHDDMLAVLLNDGNLLFPHNKVSKQFSHGSEGGDSILGLYQTTMTFDRGLVQPLTPGQQRLLAFARDGENRIFVPHTLDTVVSWVQLARVSEREVMLLGSPSDGCTISLFLSNVTCFYVCGPDGRLRHTEWISKSQWDTLPPDIFGQLKSRLARDTTLTLDQLASGKQFLAISHGASIGQDEKDGSRYATTLQNMSRQRIRITRFGGFKALGTSWRLSSVTGDFYTEDHFREWYGQQDEWLQPGETVCDHANWGALPVLWAYHGITDSGETFVAGALLEKPVPKPASSSGAHFVLPVPPQPEMAQILDKLRASYELRQQRMNSITLASLIGPTPPWLQETDGLSEFFKRQQLLLTEGQIVWGALVQANKLLFKPGESNCPGLLVHSPDSYFDDRPRELRLIGHTFFSLKDTEPSDPELKEVARLVTDELDRSMGFALPTVFSARQLLSATFMVFRKHVPNGVLSCGLFPILTHPSTPAVMMVPFEFWPIELIVLWKENGLVS